MMPTNFWLLTVADEHFQYDEIESMAVYAPSETDARALAAAEEPPPGDQYPYGPAADKWTNPEKSSCAPLIIDGPMVVHVHTHPG
jgi:hypothetical protein